jgi:hypothetical protein
MSGRNPLRPATRIKPSQRGITGINSRDPFFPSNTVFRTFVACVSLYQKKLSGILSELAISKRMR